ncbi:MAG: carbamate kinase [Candidatus Kapabacteria bacterium]|nr:carbamate kinase [Candidatus Kapabacteria bacterium]
MSLSALIAIGGNSLIQAGQRGTIDEQYQNARATANSIVKMIASGWNVIITHGNGPQVGAALLRSERASTEVYTHPLDMCVATTQGEIGYIIQRAMQFELQAAGLIRQVVTLPTMVRVNADDRAFKNPSKPIGPFYEKKVAEQRKRQLGWDIIEDAARGYRRVVASPEPVEVLELELIKTISEMGIITIALGGGGIPVISDGKFFKGCEAVIDKDRSSALLASSAKVDLFVICTEVDQVYLNYKKNNQKGLTVATIDELEQYAADGQFPAGSMGPKIESVIKFIGNGGKKAIITSFDKLMEALSGSAGTLIEL